MQRLLVLSLLIASAAPLSAQPSVEELIQRLGSSRFADRELASRALEKLGDQALPALRAASGQGDLEVRRRAVALCERIHDRKSSDGILRPRTGRLQLKDASLDRSLAEVHQRLGLPLILTNDEALKRKRSLILDTGVVSIWDAVSQFLRAANSADVMVLPGVAKDALRDHPWQPFLTFQTMANYPLVVSVGGGPAPFPIDQRTSIRFRLLPLPAVRDDTHFWLEIRPDPKIAWYQFADLRFDSIADAQGKRLNAALVTAALPQNVAQPPESVIHLLPMEPMWSMSCCVPVRFQSSSSQAIRSLTGSLTARVWAEQLVVSVDDALQAQGKSQVGLHGVTLTVEKVTRHDDEFTVQVAWQKLEVLTELSPLPRAVRVRPGVIAMRGPADLAMEGLELRGPDDKPLPRVQQSVLRGGKDAEVRGQVVFRLAASSNVPLRLVLPGRRLVTVNVPFGFEGIAIPQ